MTTKATLRASCALQAFTVLVVDPHDLAVNMADMAYRRMRLGNKANRLRELTEQAEAIVSMEGQDNG